jgi:hypothetical protein
MLSNCYQYCLIVWCGVSAFVDITALIAGADSDSLKEVETHNLEVFLKDLSGNAMLYTWTKNAYAMAARLKLACKGIYLAMCIYSIYCHIHF